MIFNELEIVSARSETKGLSVVGFPSVPKQWPEKLTFSSCFIRGYWSNAKSALNIACFSLPILL